MMNFIGADGQFINLAAVVLIEDVTDDPAKPVARITTIAGAEFELTDADAEALFKRIEYIAAETDNAMMRIQAAVAEVERQAGVTK